MTHAIKTIVSSLIRLVVLWLVDALLLAAAAVWVLPGFVFEAVGPTPWWVVVPRRCRCHWWLT